VYRSGKVWRKARDNGCEKLAHQPLDGKEGGNASSKGMKGRDSRALWCTKRRGKNFFRLRKKSKQRAYAEEGRKRGLGILTMGSQPLLNRFRVRGGGNKKEVHLLIQHIGSSGITKRLSSRKKKGPERDDHQQRNRVFFKGEWAQLDFVEKDQDDEEKVKPF